LGVWVEIVEMVGAKMGQYLGMIIWILDVWIVGVLLLR